MKPKNHRLATASIAALFIALAASPLARAADFTFTGTATGTTTWSSGTNWDAVPVSGTTTDLIFGTGQVLASGVNILTTQDIASPFLLNSLTTSYSGSGTEPSVGIQTGAIRFVSDGLTTPTIALNSTGAVPPQLVFLSAVNFGNNIAIGGASSIRFDGTITNTGGAVVTKTGTGTMRIATNNASYTGNFNVSGGVLQVGNNSSTGDAGSGTVTLSGGGGFTVRRNSGTLTLNNTITGTGNVRFQTRGSFVATINKANDYIGTTSLEASAAGVIGGIKLGIANGLPTTTTFTITTSGASVQTFDLNGFDQTLGGLATGVGGTASSAKVTLGSGTLTVNDAGARTFAGEISGAGNVVKQGAGAWTLDSANTYSGTTTVSAGTLALGAAGSVNNTSRISIDAGGAFDVSLIPSYTLSSSTSLSAGGTASPADIKGGTTVDLGSQPITLTHDGINPPLTVSQGALTLNGNPFIVNSAAPLGSGSFTLIQQASGSISQSGAFTVGGTALSGSTAALDFSDSSAVKLTLVEAPVSNTNSTLTATPATLAADNTSTSTVTLTLKDASNVALPNVGVNWSLSGTGNTVSVAENYGTTNGSGVFTFTVKSVTAGTKTVTFTVGTHTFTTNINFTVPPVGYTLAWDPALTTTGSNGAGPWNLTTANWANSGTNIIWPNNGNDNAVLGTGATLAATTSITLGTPINVANITFNTGGTGTSPQYIIVGQTLTLSNSTIDVPASAMISSTLAGSGFTKSGVGTLRIDGNSPAYAGNIALNAGTLQIGNNGLTGDLGTGTITLDGDAVFQVRTQAALTLNNTIAGSTTSALGFQLNGGITVTVAKANTYTADGGTYLQPTAANTQGILKLGIADGLPTTTALSINLNGTSLQTFDLAGFNQTVASLAGSGTASTAVITSTSGTPTLTISGTDTTTFGGLVSGTLSVSKGGSGSQTLSAANTYSGNTTVTEGTLTLDNPNANNESSTVSIAASIATLELNFDESGGPVTDTVDKLFIGGVQQIAGVYKAVGNITDAGTPIAQITGPGTLTVTSSPIVSSPYDTWATSKGLTGANNAKDLDPDNDGRNNLAEFAFNGNPLSGSDNGKVYGLTEDSNFDGDATKELILTVAVRTGTPAFAGTPSPSAAFPAEGITYTIEGSLNLGGFLTAVNVVPTPVVAGLPPAGAGYEYRSFSLDGSNGLPGKGFLRAKVTSP